MLIFILFICKFYVEDKITVKEQTEIIIHNITPSMRGLIPTDCKVSFVNPAPIKNRVTVSPFLAITNMTCPAE